MNRCPNCAAQNRDGAKFCTSCGFRLPVESPPLITRDRSPFATTATPTSSAAQNSPSGSTGSTNGDDGDNNGFATWSADTPQRPEPGKSWDASPPVNTAVPVSDEMIAALVGEVDSPAPAQQDAASSAATISARPTGNASVDELLRLARELEYGLIELAETPATQELVAGNVNLLRNALGDIQDEDELSPLRSAVSTAQERPRDVDVMLDLVLRADAIAELLTERDQLKSAIELYLDSEAGTEKSEDDSDDAIEAESDSDDDIEAVEIADEMVPGDDQPSI